MSSHLEPGPAGDAPTGGEATLLLAQAAAGDPEAEARLYHLLQGELRGIASALFARQAADHTLQPTALVNEAWMRIAKAGGIQAWDRSHFLSVAARAMRTTLIDHARRRKTLKRDGGAGGLADDPSAELEALDRALDVWGRNGIDALDLSEALERIGRDSPRQARLVELRFFGGLTREEAAEVLGISRATAARDWEIVRHRLVFELGLDADA